MPSNATVATRWTMNATASGEGSRKGGLRQEQLKNEPCRVLSGEQKQRHASVRHYGSIGKKIVPDRFCDRSLEIVLKDCSPVS
jgi:hypothetical protein